MNTNAYWEMLLNGMKVLNINGNNLDVERQM